MSLQASNPIFIFGSPRSGTSLVSRILNAHPRIGIPYESLIYSTFWPIRGRYGDLSQRANMERLMRHILAWGPVTEWEPRVDFVDAMEQLAGTGFHAVFRAVVCAWAAGQGKTRWGEKSPWHAFYWREILGAFPTARVLHVLRDPRDATLSWKRARQGPRHSLILAQQWAAYIDVMTELEANWPPAARKTVRYEALLADPPGVAREVCEFLDEPYEPSMLEFYKDAGRYTTDATNMANLARPVLNENRGKWATGLAANEVRWIEAAAGPQMRARGYTPSLPAAALRPLERLWIKAFAHPATRLWGRLMDTKGQREAMQKLRFRLAAKRRI